MKTTIALHQLTVMELGPMELADMAAATGCERVCVFANWPKGMPIELPAFPGALKRDFLAKLADLGLTVGGADFYPVLGDLDPADCKPTLALAAELGARHITSAVLDDDDARAVDKLGALADHAAAEGLKVGIEFMGLSPACFTLERAKWFVDQVGRPNLGITLDVVHVIRGGNTAADVAALDARYINNAQICDGHGLQATRDYTEEAGMNREVPGLGDFPLKEIFSAVPADIPIDLEMPSMTRGGPGVSTTDFLRDAVTRSKAILDSATRTR
jgi:sugar phosphate isomerase/epimerase